MKTVAHLILQIQLNNNLLNEHVLNDDDLVLLYKLSICSNLKQPTIYIYKLYKFQDCKL